MEDIKRIEGWTDTEKELVSKPGTLRPFFTCEPGPTMTEAKRATLFISKDDKPPKVFTEEEVKTIFKDLQDRLFPHDIACPDDRLATITRRILDDDDLHAIADKHGITL